MGTSVSIQTAVTNVTNKIKQELVQRAEASATAKCKIEIGSIRFSETKGCTLKASNMCSAKAEASLESIQTAIANFYTQLSVDQKQNAPAWFTAAFGTTTTVNDFVNDVQTKIEQTCKVDANIDETIKIQDILVSKCEAPKGQIIYFEFVNSGTSAAQCAMKLVNELEVAATNDLSIKQEQGIDWNKLIWPVVIVVIVIAVVFFVFKYLNKAMLSPADKIKIQDAQHDNYVSHLNSLIKIRDKTY